MKKKIKRTAVLLLCLLLAALFLSSDYFKRHYGYQSNEKIRFYVLLDGELLSHEQYSISGGLDVDPVLLDEYGYYSKGEYGQRGYQLSMNGRTADFWLENVNDWWRTSVILYLDSDSDSISQLNIVYNGKGKTAESRQFAWNP